MIDKFFQILFMAVMSVGILGLPLYFYLLARKKRISSEIVQDEDETDNNKDS